MDNERITKAAAVVFLGSLPFWPFSEFRIAAGTYLVDTSTIVLVVSIPILILLSKHIYFKIDLVDVFFGLYNLAILIRFFGVSLVDTVDMGLLLKHALIIFIYICARIFFSRVRLNPERHFSLLYICSFGIYSFLIYQYVIVFGASHIAPNLLVFEGVAGRNTLAAGLLFIFPLLVAGAFTVRSTYSFVLRLSTVAIAFFSIVLTQSRGAWITLAIILLISFITWAIRTKYSHDVKRNGMKLVTFLAVSLFVTAGAIFMVGDHLEDRATAAFDESGPDGSTDSRLTFLSLSWEAFGEEPIFGIGPGKFHDRVGRLTHNDYAGALAETGLIGLIFLILLVGCVWSKLFRAISLGESPGVIGFLVSGVILTIYMIFNNLTLTSLFAIGIAYAGSYNSGAKYNAHE